MVYGGGLENRCAFGRRGFESLPVRHFKAKECQMHVCAGREYYVPSAEAIKLSKQDKKDGKQPWAIKYTGVTTVCEIELPGGGQKLWATIDAAGEHNNYWEGQLLSKEQIGEEDDYR